MAAKTGDAVGGLLNATLGNLTELVIAFAALRAGQTMLVKGSIAGSIITNTLFMLGASFFLEEPYGTKELRPFSGKCLDCFGLSGLSICCERRLIDNACT